MPIEHVDDPARTVAPVPDGLDVQAQGALGGLGMNPLVRRT
jgi:hypothetical protein